MARAAVGVLAALLGVDRALQGAAALFVAESVEVAVGGQAVADGVEMVVLPTALTPIM